MDLYLSNGSRTLIQFENQEHNKTPLLKGGSSESYQDESIKFFVQELTSDTYTIRYNAVECIHDQVVESESRLRGIHSRVMLENNIELVIKDAGTIQLNQDELCMLWSESSNCKALLESNKSYKALDIYYTPELADQLGLLFPKLAHIFTKGETKYVVQPPCYLTPALKNIIFDILNCPYDEITSKYYFDLKVREYLYVILENDIRAKQSRHRFSSYERNQIHQAKELLVSNIHQTPISIRDLARKVGINEFKLKAGFKEFFNTGVFEFFQNTRMQKAKELLLQTNKPIKEICTLAGYPRMTNFITAFRKTFGYTPGSLRRN